MQRMALTQEQGKNLNEVERHRKGGGSFTQTDIVE